MGGGGGKGYVGPPLKLLGGGAWPPWPPSSYAYEDMLDKPIPGIGYVMQNQFLAKVMLNKTL